MKTDTILIIIAAVAGVAAVAFLTRKKATVSGTATAGAAVGGVAEIFNTAFQGNPAGAGNTTQTAPALTRWATTTKPGTSCIRRALAAG